MSVEEQTPSDHLDQLDELLARFRPIEKLFRVMGAAGDDVGGGALTRHCSEIGRTLADNFREHLERVFRRDGGEQD